MNICKDCSTTIGTRTLWCYQHYKKNLDYYSNVEKFLLIRDMKEEPITFIDYENRPSFLYPYKKMYILLVLYDHPVRFKTYVATALFVKKENYYEYYPNSENRLEDHLFNFSQENHIISCQGIFDKQKYFPLYGKDPKKKDGIFNEPKFICINEMCLSIWQWYSKMNILI